jgi:hypothetical protein
MQGMSACRACRPARHICMQGMSTCKTHLHAGHVDMQDTSACTGTAGACSPAAP